MKKFIKIFLILTLCLIYLLSVFNVKAQEETIESAGLEIFAESAILIDAKTGKILYQKNANEKMYPASITKILTVYLSSINLKPESVLTASDTAIFNFDRSSSHIWLDTKEEARVIDLQHASLLASANDASNMLAEGVSGTQEAFATLMNETVSELGLSNTHFTNAHGLPDENHYTTAYDMAMITRMAIKDENFLKIFSTKTYEMPATNKQANPRVFANGNAMIKNGKFNYEFAIGGKIGWTEPAGYTMVTYASKDNMDLIAVVMKESEADNRYIDTKTLFEYGFNNYKTVVIKGSEIESKTVEIKKDNYLWAKATFDINVDFNILLSQSMDDSLVKAEVEIRNEDDPEKIEGYVVLKINNEVVGEQIMNKNLEMFDISFEATKLPIIERVLDYLSIGFLGLFFLRNFVIFLRKFELPE